MSTGLSRETVAAIKELREQGLTGYEIAESLGIGKTSAYKYIRKRSYPRWTEEEKQIVIDGRARGVPLKKILKRLPRRTVAGVKHVLRKHRKRIRGDRDILLATGLISRALDAGLRPGQALRKIRKHDVFNRAREESKTDAL